VATVRTRRQRLGQHFLRDPGTARALSAALADEPPKVVEIGAGLGSLTDPLARRVKKVYALEIDSSLVDILKDRFSGTETVEVVWADALQFDFGNPFPETYVQRVRSIPGVARADNLIV
jgi:16S rRNA (adenine1518-N6/adenine1519-N6)-dimethyltransferase